MEQKNTQRLNKSWRRMAAAIFEKPVDGKVSGIHDLDMTHVGPAIELWNSHGHKVTVMHVFMAVLARCLKDWSPEMNCYTQWGDIVERKDVTVATTVLVGKDLTTVKIRNADAKSVLELSLETREYVEKRRQGTDDKALAKRHVLSMIPWPFRKWVFQGLRWLTYDWGWSIPNTGFDKDMFGSVLVSNIGALKIDYGIPALMPASNVSFVMALGKVREKPVVKDGQVVVGSILPIAGTFDHRIVDGYHISKMLECLVYYFDNPHELLNDAEREAMGIQLPPK